MFKNTIFFLLKAICISYILSFWVLPILCGSIFLSLMVSLITRSIGMGLQCFRGLFDSDHSNQNNVPHKKFDTVTNQPSAKNQTRSGSAMSSHDMITRSKRNRDLFQSPPTSPKKSKPQETVENEKLSSSNPTRRHKRNQNKRKSQANRSAKPSKNQTKKTGGRSPSKSDQLEDDNLENAKTKPIKLDVEKILEFSPSEKKSLANENILIEFEKSLRGEYQLKLKGEKPHQFWFEVQTLKDSGEIEKQICSFTDLIPSNLKLKMIVYGHLRFGKSQFCQDLTSIWVSLRDGNAKNKNSSLKAYRFLIWIDFSKESNTVDLEGCIVERYYNMISNISSKDDFRNAWKSQMHNTLIVLDGFEKLKQSQKYVKSFISGNEFFEGASFILTSTPIDDSEMKLLFQVQADICGLSETVLKRMIGNEKSSTIKLENFIQTCKVQELYGISPSFAQLVAKVFKERPELPSLYDLLDKMMCITFQNSVFGENEFDELGQFLLQQLKHRRFVFEQQELQEKLQEKCKVLKECGVLLECSSKQDGIVKLVFSHMMFMIYFCVRYLRKECEKFDLTDDRKSLVKQYLSFEDCSEEYIASCKNSDRTYIVGVVPEISFQANTGLFKMAPDVGNSNLNSAFEMQNLLLRIDAKRLGMFGIREVDESLLQDSFFDLLNMLDFSDFTIEQSYFTNAESSLRFMKLAAMDDEKLAMLCVASSNEAGQIQDIILEFKDYDLKQMSSFLQKLATEHFGPCELDTSVGALEFTTSIVFSALKACNDCYTKLTLGASNLDPLSLVTWEIISSSENKTRSVFVYRDKNKTAIDKYNNQKCQQMIKNTNTSELIGKMKNSLSNVNELCITICIKTTH